MTKVDRREFLKQAAVLSVAAGTTLPGAGADEPSAAQQLQWKKAPCRLCGVGCGLLIGIQGGRAVAVRGDPASPVSRGLGCVKGYQSVQVLYGTDRIRRAMIRRNGTLVEAPMAEALDLVAQRLMQTVAEHGSGGVALYGSAQWAVQDAYVAGKFFKGALGTNNVETSARLYSAAGMTGARDSLGLDGGAGCYEDLDNADVFVIWNGNLAERDPVLFSRMLEHRRRNPSVRIVEISSSTSRTSYAADLALVHTPQSEIALANAICSDIVAREQLNHDFVRRHVSFRRGAGNPGYVLDGDIAWDPAAEEVTLQELEEFLTEYRPEMVEALSGVSAASIRYVASLYGDPARKVLSVWGAGVHQHSRGSWLNNALYNIHLLTGKIAAPGNGVLSLADQPSSGAGVHDAGARTDGLPRGSVLNEADRSLAAQIWGVPADRIPARPTHTALGMFRALERGDIRFMWIQATNPMLSLPNLTRYRRAVEAADRFIVVSEAYPTPTTDVADVVLPSAMWLEREGVFINSERRVQHFERMLQPPGDAMSDAWQMIEVARRAGHGDLFAYDRANHAAQIWEEYRRFHTTSADALPGLEELRQRPGLLWPHVAGSETRWRYNTAHDPAADAAHGAFDFYGHADHRAWVWLRPHETAAENTSDEFPFWLTVGVVIEQWGGGAMTQRVPLLHRSAPTSYAELSSTDAARMGIRAGDRIRLVSRRGSLELEARIDHRTQPPSGQVFVPVFDEGVPVNTLTLDALCPVSGQPDYGKCAVRVERLARSAG